MQLADAIRIAHIRLWLLLRDPLDHPTSVYGQMVKRHGFSGHIDDWLSIYEFPSALLDFLEAVQTRGDRLSLQVNHYGSERGQLLNRMQSWLSLPEDACWQQLPYALVNRSLTAEELVLMRWLNRRLGDSAAVVGELLVDRLPRLLPTHPQASPKAQAAFLLRWSGVVERLYRCAPAILSFNCRLIMNLR